MSFQAIDQWQLDSASGAQIAVSLFGLMDYADAHAEMKKFAAERSDDSMDQIWLLQHPPIYTQGTACVQQPLAPSPIELCKTDRGGQLTYHGPGQIIMYPLLKLSRYRRPEAAFGIKALVRALEQSVIDLLAQRAIDGQRRQDAPGVYVAGKKISALGLRIKRGTSYHGLSLNVDMDLSPFSNIDPCGYAGLEVTQLRELVDCELVDCETEAIGRELVARFASLI